MIPPSPKQETVAAKLSAVNIIGGNPRLGRKKMDFYPTPNRVTEALISRWRPNTKIWECASGDGAMSKVLERYGEVISTDIRTDGYGQGGVDFLSTMIPLAPCIITNPPFCFAEDFIAHAHRIGIQKMALLLKIQFWNAAKRYKLWKMWEPSFVFPLTWRPDFDGRGSPVMDMQWTVWSDSHPCYFSPIP